MKKIILLFLGVILIAGCSNKKEKELCNKVYDIDIKSFTQEGKYDDLTKVLKDNYSTYCKGSSSDVCKTLDEYIKQIENEIKLMEFEDCSAFTGNFKKLCESGNQLEITRVEVNAIYNQEKMKAACNGIGK